MARPGGESASDRPRGQKGFTAFRAQASLYARTLQLGASPWRNERSEALKCCGPLRRARRFNRSDPFFGNLYDPLSLHKYAYGELDPVAFLDPTGLSGVPGTVYQAVGTKVHWMFSIFVYGMGWSSKPGATLGVLLPDLFPPTDPQHLLKPDLTDTRYKKYFELKASHLGQR